MGARKGVALEATKKRALQERFVKESQAFGGRQILASMTLWKARARNSKLSSELGPAWGAWTIMTTGCRLKIMLPGGPQRGSLGSYEKARLARRSYFIKES